MNKQADLYNQVSFRVSREVTKGYSTSFYSASRLFSLEDRLAIWGIYGFVRMADEIVDTFEGYDQEKLLNEFEKDYYTALERGISLNPILNAFLNTVRKYDIPNDYIQAFLTSMRKDLSKKNYMNEQEAADYIYGSADVVGLMCLRVFCKIDDSLFEELQQPAMKLGSAFQKVNFLRDLKNDQELLGRTYFPHIIEHGLDDVSKKEIVTDIKSDFTAAKLGLRKLPREARLAVTVAFDYYMSLLSRIERTPADQLLSKRIRVPNSIKLLIFSKAWVLKKLKFFGQ